MRQTIFPVIAMVFLLACNDAEKTVEQNAESNQMPVAQTAIDTAEARQELNAMADEMHSLFKKKDIAFVDKFMAKDGIYLGTDPNEILNFDDLRAYEQQLFSDTAMNIPDYKISRREIVINGPSAIIIDQYFFPDISEKVMLRNISHARHEDGKWVFDMFSWNFIPKNEDVPKINQAL
ncbi:nuclear transport factor 2 family protein [Pontibacter anaerobius]|uniref:Nuclear transport factor 2 family protein n=1 Tax=Pontibacter anaerobius TaxID=2993940 RepID=A0ABT3RKT6_9BACT|nr:nuclear transport factor 2 family protein [Pontibacter anaerobius]MCX2742071.1 nuclear transport factor 2 family protein [Pontibacter anaerobius]